VIRSSLLRTAFGLGMTLSVASATMVTAPPGIAQQGPIRLFPERGPPPRQAPAPEQEPPRLPGPVEQRAPRAEPGPPSEPAGEVAVERLAAPELDAIGLSGPTEGGFDRPLWQGSDPELVSQLLSDLPVVTLVPPLRALARRLLVTGSPVRGREPGDLLALRIERLTAMGDLDGAKALLDRLPPLATDSALARRAAEVALLLDDDHSACRLADSVGPTSEAEFWAKIAVYCRLVEDDRSGARLGLDLMREAGQTGDGAFFTLASAMIDQTGPPPLGELGEPAPVHLALLALAQWPLPQDALARAAPPVLAAAAREPALAGAQRVTAIEQAFLVGATPADRVAASYAEQDAAAGADLLPGAPSDWDAATRASAYVAVRAKNDPVARGELLNATWQAAHGAERFLIADVFAAPFVELPVERQQAGVAPSVARALLATGRPVPAVGWLSLLTAEAGQSTRAQREAAALMPLFALAGVGGSDAVPRIDGAALAAWRLATTADQALAERLFALLEGVGAPVEAGAWRTLLAGHGQRQQPAPAAVLWRGLELAATERRVGDTVLFVLQMLNGQPEAVHPEVLVACLRALSRVGLDRDARAIAVATALISDL
jgi:hypothetical protein